MFDDDMVVVSKGASQHRKGVLLWKVEFDDDVVAVSKRASRHRKGVLLWKVKFDDDVVVSKGAPWRIGGRLACLQELSCRCSFFKLCWRRRGVRIRCELTLLALAVLQKEARAVLEYLEGTFYGPSRKAKGRAFAMANIDLT